MESTVENIVELTDHLPQGYVARPATMDDLEAIVETINIATRDLIGGDKFTVSDFKIDWGLQHFNLETDTRLVLSPEGQVAGIYEYWDTDEPHVRYVVWGRVHPDHEGQGVGSHLLSWVDQRAARSLENAPDGARAYLHAVLPAVILGAGVLLEDNGYRLIRHFLRMVVELNGSSAVPPGAPIWPQGITVRPVDLEHEVPEVVQAVRDSFKDHWGYVEMPFEDDFQHWRNIIENDEKFDPSLWFLAMDGDEIAGVSLCRQSASDDPQMGWVGALGVRRRWRRRGLGLALLLHSFSEFERRGKHRVGLGVDAGSLTGATRLYTKAGMHSDPLHQQDLYEKELRPGIELGTQTVED